MGSSDGYELTNQFTDSILRYVSKGIYDDRLKVMAGVEITFERFKSQSRAFEMLKSYIESKSFVFLFNDFYLLEIHVRW
jgi:hypothetical protein